MSRQVEAKSWPTARTSDAEGGRIDTEMTEQGFKSKRHKSNQTFGAKLRDAVETHEEQKSWPTTTTRDWKDTMNTVPPCIGKTRGLTLGNAVAKELQKNWPTATTRDWKDTNATVPPSRANPSKQTLGQRVAHVGLQDQAKLNKSGKSQESWPTPRANKVHPEITEQNRDHLANRKKANLEEDIAGHCGKATGKLNPNWVEHLMGLPAGWTDLGSWETE